jgi:hypothetical protein
MHETTIAVLAEGMPLIICAVLIISGLNDILKHLGHIQDSVRHIDIRKSYADAGFHE